MAASSGVGEGSSKVGPYLGLATRQPLVKEDVVGAGDVRGEGVLPDRGVWGLVQVGQVFKCALAEVLQGCGEPGGEQPRLQHLPFATQSARPPSTGPGLHFFAGPQHVALLDTGSLQMSLVKMWS